MSDDIKAAAERWVLESERRERIYLHDSELIDDAKVLADAYIAELAAREAAEAERAKSITIEALRLRNFSVFGEAAAGMCAKGNLAVFTIGMKVDDLSLGRWTYGSTEVKTPANIGELDDLVAALLPQKTGVPIAG